MSWRSLREARRYLLPALAGELALFLSGGRCLGRTLGGMVIASLFFFRDPARSIAARPDHLYATADGVVVGVDRVTDPWLAGGDALRISTFLSMLDVHVTRSPVGGNIVLDEELPGGFAPAFLKRAGWNRRKRLAIDGEGGRVVVVQIAGLLARRITSWVGMGSTVSAGDRLGLIHFGSRTELLVPAGDAEALVSVGQRVRAGVDAVACYRGDGAHA